MDANADDDLPPPAGFLRGRFARRLVPAALFAAGAAFVGVVGTGRGTGGGWTLRDQPEPGVTIRAAGWDAVPLARAAPETTATVTERDDAGWSTILMEVTAYCPCTKCCGPRAHGVTASGVGVDYNGGLFVAADTDLLPFGTRLVVPGYASEAGEVVEVVDRGGAIKGYRLDVFYADHAAARAWGRQILPVRVESPDGRVGR